MQKNLTTVRNASSSITEVKVVVSQMCPVGPDVFNNHVNILTWICFTDGTCGNLRGDKICTMSHYRWHLASKSQTSWIYRHENTFRTSRIIAPCCQLRLGQKNKTQLYDESLFFNDYKKNEVSFSATLRNIGSPRLKHNHFTDVSMCSGETNFIFIRLQTDYKTAHI
jgi:hypothetical protein